MSVLRVPTLPGVGSSEEATGPVSMFTGAMGCVDRPSADTLEETLRVRLAERLDIERYRRGFYERLMQLQATPRSTSPGLPVGPLAVMVRAGTRHIAMLREVLSNLGVIDFGALNEERPTPEVFRGVARAFKGESLSAARCLEVLLIAELGIESWAMLIVEAERLHALWLVSRLREALADEQLHHAEVRRWLASRAMQRPPTKS